MSHAVAEFKPLNIAVLTVSDTRNEQTDTRITSYNVCYTKLLRDAEAKTLLGAILVGDNSDYDQLLQLYLNKVALPEPVISLLVPGEACGGAAPMVLPDTATICSCHNVTKGDVVAAVKAGNHTVADVKGCTKAGTGCGGCSNLLKQVVDQTLLELGMEANNHVCEHFSFTRQELFHQISDNFV